MPRKSTQNPRIRRLEQRIATLQLDAKDQIIRLKNSPEPPQYAIDALYQRKLRIVITGSTTSPTVTKSQLIDQLLPGLTSTAKLAVDSVHLWADPGATLSVSFRSSPTNQDDAGYTAFNDYGTSGHTRPCIRIRYPKVMRETFHDKSTGSDSIFIVASPTTGTIIADIICRFRI